ncbi:MAG: hypothetical protein SO191_08425 [Butyricimonas virosa]|uniref:hypothetical protein n=2 Tax=Butyricimonas virosa TaxID=544645 RepID=UPI0015F30A60|nr:hypothetical protein [Butyricimonas virosa]MDY4904892.1 hypothetical protein [Butyricimonas virosa]
MMKGVFLLMQLITCTFTAVVARECFRVTGRLGGLSGIEVFNLRLDKFIPCTVK